MRELLCPASWSEFLAQKMQQVRSLENSEGQLLSQPVSVCVGLSSSELQTLAREHIPEVASKKSNKALYGIFTFLYSLILEGQTWYRFSSE